MTTSTPGSQKSQACFFVDMLKLLPCGRHMRWAMICSLIHFWSATMSDANSSNRRDFLQQTAGAAAGLALVPGSGETAQQNSQPVLPTIRLGTHQVTRLIIGGNPIYGYSHFNRLLGQHQTAWHTPERVVELLRRCEQAG